MAMVLISEIKKENFPFESIILKKNFTCVIGVISLGVSKDLVHELPSALGRASSPHSVVFKGTGPHATTLPCCLRNIPVV